MSKEFDVMKMAGEYAEENNLDVAELFRQNPVSGNIKRETDEAATKETTSTPVSPTGKTMWTPPKEALEDLPELNQAPLTYNVNDITVPEDQGLMHIADDNAMQASRESMDDLTRKRYNIYDAKVRHGIKEFQIPEGVHHVKIFATAGDTNYKRAQAGLDEIFTEIIQYNPEFIREWIEPEKHGIGKSSVAPMNVFPKLPHDVTKDNDVTSPEVEESEENIHDGMTPSAKSGEDLRVIINKSQAPEICWDPEEMEKIRLARKVELTITEDLNLKYTNLEDLDGNAVDAVLSKYVRKVNDVVAALPASRYRATFTGLNYAEVIDLSYSQDMNNLDGERKKWTIIYNHMQNPSIGPWEEYKWYISPVDNKKIKIHINAVNPMDDKGRPIEVTTVTKFDDFLQKTSFMDMEFCIWKILCATAMDKEIIAIDCHGVFKDSPCKKSYDWVYSPNELLVVDNINPAVLEEMKRTVEANTLEEISKNYAESMLVTNNTVELTTSKFGVIFGHISAYDYLNYIYGEIKALDEQDDPQISKALSYSTLTVVKAFIIPREDGSGYVRIKGTKNLIRLINTLDEIDWQTLTELVRIMIEPYQFTYSLRNIQCPQCKTRSDIPIEDMTRLLFIVAQSLSSVQVELKRQ